MGNRGLDWSKNVPLLDARRFKVGYRVMDYQTAEFGGIKEILMTVPAKRGDNPTRFVEERLRFLADRHRARVELCYITETETQNAFEAKEKLIIDPAMEHLLPHRRNN